MFDHKEARTWILIVCEKQLVIELALLENKTTYTGQTNRVRLEENF